MNFYAGYQLSEQDIRELAAEREILEGVLSALNAAGCPVGNEHKTYSIVERIAWLHKTRDYAWKQIDEGRAKLNIAREALNEIRSKTTQAGYDSGDSGVCAIAEAAISKINP